MLILTTLHARPKCHIIKTKARSGTQHATGLPHVCAHKLNNTSLCTLLLLLLYVYPATVPFPREFSIKILYVLLLPICATCGAHLAIPYVTTPEFWAKSLGLVSSSCHFPRYFLRLALLRSKIVPSFSFVNHSR